MYGPIFYTAGRTDALTRAEAILHSQGCPFASEPNLSVTHLLLDIPAFAADGSLRCGGSLDDILPFLSPSVKICGGYLHNHIPDCYQKIDLLEDPFYTAENARITAHCAVALAMKKLPRVLFGCPVLIIGCGRIGKCLTDLLKNMGARVTVAARKVADRSILEALGYETLDTAKLAYSLVRFRVIFNTVPSPILSAENLAYAPDDCLKIDLASIPGMDSPDVIQARGLPGKDAPESSAVLIAQTLLRLR